MQIPPLPPEALRRIVGPVDEAFWRNESGAFFLNDLPFVRGPEEIARLHETVFDFGCGSGRVAIQMMMQKSPPRKYLGIDISKEMISWCQEELTTFDPNFSFRHHDVWNMTYAPQNSRNKTLPLPRDSGRFNLVIAHSVFTHLLLDQSLFYLEQLSNILSDTGIFYSTWFLFNRKKFPVLADFQNCLYVNEIDCTQAVYYDFEWFVRSVRALGLNICWVDWTRTPGYHTSVFLTRNPTYPDISGKLVPPATIIGY